MLAHFFLEQDGLLAHQLTEYTGEPLASEQ